jgi:hypothetical protein
MTPIRMPKKYHVIEKEKNNGYTKLMLRRTTDHTDTFWWQISSSNRGRRIHCTFDVSPPTSYYKNWGNILVGDTNVISDPIGLSPMTQNQTIDLNNLENIPSLLQEILEYEEA